MSLNTVSGCSSRVGNPASTGAERKYAEGAFHDSGDAAAFIASGSPWNQAFVRAPG
ncbi:MAG: hypothetical protein LBF87_02015 [Treponema sp.]|nr:hypothetical protein [Treponema sp.]